MKLLPCITKELLADFLKKKEVSPGKKVTVDEIGLVLELAESLLSYLRELRGKEQTGFLY